MKNAKILSQMTSAEKIDLSVGADFWRTRSYTHHDIPALMVADGPHGVRYQAENVDSSDIHDSSPATCFPTSVTIACSWDRNLMSTVAAAIAEEAATFGVDVILGPGVNIKRNPLCGRNFEYYAEDPVLSGHLAGAYAAGLQENGVGACLKHFAANSQEYKRFSSDSLVDERTLREIYFPAFELAIKEGQPDMVMSAYNKLGGTYCSDHRWLLTDVLRDDFGFDGVVVSDWGGMHDRVLAYQAGCDLAMPGGSRRFEKQAMAALEKGDLDEADVDRTTDRLITLARKAVERRRPDVSFDPEEHHGVARKATENSAVLLKNDGLLPLRTDKVALVGYMAEELRFQGSGSSHINPTQLHQLVDLKPDWTYARGCDVDGNTTDEQLREVAQVSAAAEVCVVVAGLPDYYESEGFDRSNMKMPEGHLAMIEAAAAANPNTVVVLLCGSAVEVPWYDCVKSILYLGLPGQAGAEAIISLLTGTANPGGKLAETWPLVYEDVPCAEAYGYPKKDAQYREGLYVGYRYYSTAGVPVRFPFGFGLSYTSFEYSDLKTQGRTVSCTVTNTGKCSGREVVQLYVAPPAVGPHRPRRELKDFGVVELAPGESKDLTFTLNDRSFALWQDGWRIQKGTYTIEIAASADDVRLTKSLVVDGENLSVPHWEKGSWYAKPTRHRPTTRDFENLRGLPAPTAADIRRGLFNEESSIREMAEHSVCLKILNGLIAGVIRLMYCGERAALDFRRSYSFTADCALFSLVSTSQDALTETMAQGLVDIANGHFFKGVGKLIKRH